MPRLHRYVESCAASKQSRGCVHSQDTVHLKEGTPERRQPESKQLCCFETWPIYSQCLFHFKNLAEDVAIGQIPVVHYGLHATVHFSTSRRDSLKVKFYSSVWQVWPWCLCSLCGCTTLRKTTTTVPAAELEGILCRIFLKNNSVLARTKVIPLIHHLSVCWPALGLYFL